MASDDRPPGLPVKGTLFEGLPDDALATYLLRLPFNLALDPSEVLTIQIQPDESGATPSAPVCVDFRLLRIKTGGERYFPERMIDAAAALYDSAVDIVDPDALYAPDIAYETWISAETRLALAKDEHEYGARTLERCLQALWVVLTAYRLTTRDQNVFPVGPASVGKQMVVGVKVPGKPWRHLTTMLMRPESGIPAFPDRLSQQQLGAFGQAVALVSGDHPFIRGKDLELSAYRQAYALDDLPAAVISLQTAMESTLFDLWRMSLVDEGRTQTEIEGIAMSDTSFKPLLTTILPPILGGRWSLDHANTAVGRYWHALYELRNDVIHSAAIVQEWQYEAATEAHKTFIRFLVTRLFERWRSYPRTLLAFGRARGFPEGLEPSRKASETLGQIASAPEPYWLPQKP